MVHITRPSNERHGEPGPEADVASGACLTKALLADAEDACGMFRV